MAVKDRKILLFEILNDLRSTAITVRRVRDEILARTIDGDRDRSSVRRWVNGKLETMMRNGLVAKCREPGSTKAHFEILPVFDDHYAHQQKLKALDCNNEGRIIPNTSFEQLEQELNQYRRTIISQMCEIEEYQRIKSNFPHLEEVVTSQFNEVLEENYRLLGKVKALENVLAHSHQH